MRIADAIIRWHGSIVVVVVVVFEASGESLYLDNLRGLISSPSLFFLDDTLLL